MIDNPKAIWLVKEILDKLRIPEFISDVVNRKSSQSEGETIIKLDLSNLDIEKIKDDTFDKVPNLKYLNLANNRVKVISKKNFQYLDNLRILIIANNEISSIDDYAFENNVQLKYLDLSSNQLTKVGLFLLANLLDLEYLSLRRNKFSSTSIDRSAFGNLSKLTNLNLSDNALYTIRFQLSPLVHLEEILISNCHLLILPDDIFKNKKKLQKIDLRDNSIENIREGTFSDNIELSHLNLQDNDLNKFDFSLIANNNDLEMLVINQNKKINGQILLMKQKYPQIEIA